MVEWPLPLSATQPGPLGLNARPQALTSSMSCRSATPAWLETRLCYSVAVGTSVAAAFALAILRRIGLRLQSQCQAESDQRRGQAAANHRCKRGHGSTPLESSTAGANGHVGPAPTTLANVALSMRRQQSNSANPTHIPRLTARASRARAALTV